MFLSKPLSAEEKKNNNSSAPFRKIIQMQAENAMEIPKDNEIKPKNIHPSYKLPSNQNN